MTTNVNVNGLSLVHQTSGGVAAATAPDVCKTPSAGGPIPVPYPNVAMATDLVGGTATVTANGSSIAIAPSKFARSTGDEAGVAGGVVSSVFAMEAAFLSFSPTVLIEGKPACRLSDKMLMNKGNTICAAGVVQAPVVTPSTPAQIDWFAKAPPDELPEWARKPPKEAPKVCSVKQMVVSCGHTAARKYKVDVRKSPGTILAVMSDYAKPETITVEVKGKCGLRSKTCPQVRMFDDERNAVAPKATNQFEVKPPPAASGVVPDWPWIFRNIIVPVRMTPAVYAIEAHTCGTRETLGEQTYVEVYAKAGCRGKVSISFGQEMTSDAFKSQPKQKGDYKVVKSRERKSMYELSSNADWKIDGELEIFYGELSYKLSSGLKQSENAASADPLTAGLFKALRMRIATLGVFFKSLKQYGIVSQFKVRWPRFEMEAGMQLAELAGKPGVAPEGSFKMALAPLIGAEIQADLFDWIIRFAGAFAGPPGVTLANILVRCKHLAEKGYDSKYASAKGVLQLLLTVGGDVQGALAWKFAQGKTELQDGCLLGGGVDFSIEAKIAVQGRVWKVVTAGGAAAGIKSADGKSAVRLSAEARPAVDKDDPILRGAVSFNGLAFYYLWYYEISVGGAEAQPPNNEARTADDLTQRAADLKKKLQDKQKAKGSVPVNPVFGKHGNKREKVAAFLLLDPFVWPAPNAAAAPQVPLIEIG